MSQLFQQVIIMLQESPPQNTSVEAANNINEALKNLKKTITTSDSVAITDLDKDTRDFLYNWLQNNKTHVSGQSGHWWKQEGSVHDLSSVEERLLQQETDKDSLQLQVTVLEDQLDSQTHRVSDLERALKDKQQEHTWIFENPDSSKKFKLILLKYPMTWFRAREACTARGARLAQPDNHRKNDFIVEKLKSVGQTTCWFGAGWPSHRFRTCRLRALPQRFFWFRHLHSPL